MIWRFLGGTVLVASVLAVNGGYVYRTQCPLPSGATETSWTYGIDDVLPYIRSASAPCVSHTGTRLLLSALSIAPLKTARAHSREPSVPATDQEVARGIATILRAAAVLHAQEESWVKSVTRADLLSDDPSIALHERQFTRTSRTLEARLSALPIPSDQTLTRFRSLYLSDLRTLDESRSTLVADVQGRKPLPEIGADLSRLNAKHLALGRQLLPLAHELDSRYAEFAGF